MRRKWLILCTESSKKVTFSVPNVLAPLPTVRECVRMGAAGAGNHRPQGHHLLHPHILTDQISEILLCSVAELIGHETKHAYLHGIKHFLNLRLAFLSK